MKWLLRMRRRKRPKWQLLIALQPKSYSHDTASQTSLLCSSIGPKERFLPKDYFYRAPSGRLGIKLKVSVGHPKQSQIIGKMERMEER